MEQNNIIMRLHAVINTLNAATLRADQIDAIQRINACTQELRGVINTLEAEQKDETKEG